jgi:hypothetical protein
MRTSTIEVTRVGRDFIKPLLQAESLFPEEFCQQLASDLQYAGLPVGVAYG